MLANQSPSQQTSCLTSAAEGAQTFCLQTWRQGHCCFGRVLLGG